MLKTRIISAIIGITLILLIIYAGGLYWQGLVLLLALVGYYEYLHMIKGEIGFPLVAAGYLLLLAVLLPDYLGAWFYPVVLAALLLLIIRAVFGYPRIKTADVALVFLGAFFLGFMLNFALRLGDLEQGSLAVLLAFLLTWASDTGGYFGGRFWGKNKLAPLLSPNKTREGALGCIVLTVITAVVFFIITDMETASGAYLVLLGILASIMAQLGDLFISSIKRNFKVKDTGWIIPGHGGVLDRFDSFLLVVPLVYYFWMIFIV